MTTTIDIGTLIVATSGICGGRPRIEGTRIAVQRIAVWYKTGMSAEDIVEEIPHLTLAQVHAALAYYYANQAQIDADILSEEAEYKHLENENKIGVQ